MIENSDGHKSAELTDHQSALDTVSNTRRSVSCGYGRVTGSDTTQAVDYVTALLRCKWAPIVGVVLGGLLGVGVSLVMDPLYMAETSLEIRSLNPDFMNMDEVSVEQTSRSVDKTDIQTQIEVLKSHTLATRTMAKLGWRPPPDDGAQEDTVPQNGWTSRLANLLGSNAPGARGPVDARAAVIEQAADSVTVRSAGDTRIVKISVESPDPQIAADFANTLADEFISLNLEARWSSNQRTSEWLGKQLADMKEKLQRSEDELQRYARSAGLLYTGDDRDVSEGKFAQIQRELANAEAERVRAQSRYELAVSSPPAVLPDVVDDATLRNYRERLTDLMREKAELATTYAAGNPKLKRIEAQIKTVQAAFDQARDAILGRIESQYKEAARREELLQQQYSAQARIVSDQSERAIRYNILKKDVDSYREHYEMVLRRVKDASVAGALSASNVRIVDPAKPPVTPHSPKVPMNAVLGSTFGCLLGILFVVARERGDRSLRNPGETASILELPELGLIPDVDRKLYRTLRSDSQRRTLRIPGGSKQESVVKLIVPEQDRTNGEDTNGGFRADKDVLELVTWRHRPSVVAESFHSAIASILFSSEGKNRPSTVVLTSANPSEGKTTVTSNLAIALAQLGRKVLLVDGDLRRSRIHEIFDEPGETGLAEYLEGEFNPPEAVDIFVRRTFIPGVDILPAGGSLNNPEHLLFSARIPKLLEHCATIYDMVLIDTPPVLSVPDARFLGRVSDAVILVVRSGCTTREDALLARVRLEEDGTTILGTILNQWNPKAKAGAYGYGRYYQKQYGS